MSESIFCEYCEKVLSQHKGEYDHGCLDCHGQPYADKIFWLKKENKKLQAENAKLRECIESFVDKYFDLPLGLRLQKGIKEGKESLRARQVLKELEEK